MRSTIIFLWSVFALVAPMAAQGQSLSLTQGTNIALAASPDGKQIVLDLQGTLWVMPVAGGAAKAITDPLADARPWQLICSSGECGLRLGRNSTLLTRSVGSNQAHIF
ncbi:MAG: hypothetical protein EXR11_12965 [Rhodospirillaceae bacterium]|nr:hypothetical protein [Rhodospirillaceae bacterium]